MSFKGTKYTGEYRDAVSIAKLIRKDIKDAVKAGSLPADLKVSVRSSYYSGGQSIDVTWHAPNTTIYSIECTCRGLYNGHEVSDTCYDRDGRYVGLTFTKTGEEIEETLRSIMNAYNYDNSDAQIDYFERLFYGHVQFDRWGKGPTPANLDYPLGLAELIIALWDGGRDRNLLESLRQAELLTKLEVN